VALTAEPTWKPETPLPADMRSHWTPPYGLKTYGDLFTSRQLVALNTFSNLVQEVRERVRTDALAAGRANESITLDNGGRGAWAYADTVGTASALAVDKAADYWSTICFWHNGAAHQKIVNTFSRQAVPMSWDFAEGNPFSKSSGHFMRFVSLISEVLDVAVSANTYGAIKQEDATRTSLAIGRVISSDPPYYDNIGYADLSDFFYVWLRRTLKPVFPELFATLAVPKAAELVATPYRHGGKDNAEKFFLDGMTLAMGHIAMKSHPAFPATIYYAFKQIEAKSASGVASTGWETFLAAVINAGFALHGTWPMRTEYTGNLKKNVSALASSVVLVCQRRLETAATLSRNEFRRQLREKLPQALTELERANIAPVDVAQAAIGPGMAIFSGAKAVLNPDDSPMSVREALIEINTALDEYLSQDEGELDADSRFALTFFESYGYEDRSYGDAEGLAIARNLSVDGVADAGILSSVAGKVRLYQRNQLPEAWDPTTDRRLCVWEATQHLIKRLESNGEGAAAELLLQLKNVSGHGDLATNCRALAYRLYNHCEKKKQAEEARSYNGLVIAWPELERLASASSTSSSAPLQTTLI
jgi:putative DNA methylase